MSNAEFEMRGWLLGQVNILRAQLGIERCRVMAGKCDCPADVKAIVAMLKDVVTA